ncbi:unnamed protein product, partial [Chrysoparadoxa australica]
MEGLKKAFKVFTVFRSGMEVDIDEFQQAAVVKMQGLVTAAELLETGAAKTLEAARDMAKKKLEAQLENAKATIADPESLLEVEEAADPGPRQYANVFFLVYYLSCAAMAGRSYWNTEGVDCSSATGSYHFFLSLFFYKPFFVPMGAVTLMVSTDIMFVTSKLP